MKRLGNLFFVGARTALGSNAIETALLLRTGATAIGAAPLAGEDAHSSVTMAFDRTLSPLVFGDERMELLLGAALLELEAAVRAAPKALRLRDLKLRAAIALPEVAHEREQTLLKTRLTALLRNALGDVDVRFSPPNGSGGGAGLGALLEDALGALAARRVDALIVGGVHSDYDPARIQSLISAGRLFSLENLDAVLPGEAAALTLIARADFDAQVGLEPTLGIYGLGGATGQISPHNDQSVYADTALSSAIEQATQTLADELKVGFAITDVGTELHRSRELYAAITRTESQFMPPFSIDSPAQRIGSLGAASLPLGLVLAADMFRRGYAPSPFGLLLGGSDSGERAAILVGS